MTRLLSQFVLSRYARHKLRQLHLAGEAYVRLTPLSRRKRYFYRSIFMTITINITEEVSLLTEIICILLWFFLSFVVANGAKKRNRSYLGYLFLSFLTTPFVVGFILLMIKDKNIDTNRENVKTKKVNRENEGILI
jgi:ABC-type spermidine/putrescine transport system permease subunit I